MPATPISSKGITVTAGRPDLVPPKWRREIQSVLIPADKIARRVRQLAQLIKKDYKNSDLVIISLLNGTVLFLADLIRHLDIPVKLDFMGVTSYRTNTLPGKPLVTKQPQLELSNREVLLIDDILDTGKTLNFALGVIHAYHPRSVKTCVLLDKPSRRVVPITADYVGFRIPNHFVVGYGLDYAERYRNLPFIGVLKPEVYATTPIL